MTMRPARPMTLTVAAILLGSGLTAVGVPSAAAAVHVENPYLGATVYVNPDWSARAAAEPGGERIAGQPTAVWLDSVASIEAPEGSGYSTSLRGHLDNALEQGATLAQIVIYNLPGRDCRLESFGTPSDPAVMDRYQHEYIDPIAAIEADPKYSSLRIVNLIEPDSMATVVTNSFNQNPGNCETAVASGHYQTGVAYALGALHAAGPNTYQYLDASHHGILSWDDTFFPAAQLLTRTARAATGAMATVDGISLNTANYSVLTEPYFTAGTVVAGTHVRQTKWVDWGEYVDELTFAEAFRAELISEGFTPGLGVVIDTSRNGWGGPRRPTRASSSIDANTYVEESRIDRRLKMLNACNQAGAGLGERPQAAPRTGIDAYAWVKPPGESDGSRSAGAPGPGNPSGKPADVMCDPNYLDNSHASSTPTGALPNPPAFGSWFSTQFQQLMANAYPPL